jgi:hypothetical protein
MGRIGIDFVQEKFMGAGPQDNESAFEQAKDEQISDCEFLRVCVFFLRARSDGSDSHPWTV